MATTTSMTLNDPILPQFTSSLHAEGKQIDIVLVSANALIELYVF